MPASQNTSPWVSIAVQASPPLDADVPPNGSDISSLLAGGYGSGKIELRIRSDQTETVSNVRLSLREDDTFAVVAQAGQDDRLFAGLDLVAGRSVKLVVSDPGRPTHAVLSAIFAGAVQAWVKRVED